MDLKYIIFELLKWSPGIIYPVSHIVQLVDMYKMKHDDKHPLNIDLDMTTFILFYIGNMGAYFFNKDYFSVQVWLAYIIPSILEAYIYVYAKILDNEKINAIISGIILTVVIIAVIAVAYKIQNHKRLVHKIDIIGEYAGFLPAILFPLGILLQFIKIVKKKSFNLVSKNGWVLMAVGNIGSYILANQFRSWKSISAFVLSAIFSICIVIYIAVNQKNDES